MRLVIGIILGVLAGLAVRRMLPPATMAAPEVVAVEPVHHVSNEPKQAPPAPPKYPNPAYRETEAVYVKGFATWGHRVIVQLSDGTRWDNRDPKLERVERTFVQYEGKKYPVRVNWSPANTRGGNGNSGNMVQSNGGVAAGQSTRPGSPTGAANTGAVVSGGASLFESYGEAVIPVNKIPPQKMGFSALSQ
jgi:hypothetical protein